MIPVDRGDSPMNTMMEVRVGRDKKDKRFLTGTTLTLVILRFLGMRYRDYSIGQELFVSAYGQLDKIAGDVHAGLAGFRWVNGRGPMNRMVLLRGLCG